MKKSSTLNMRIDPILKEALKEAARKENRSISNLLEVMIRQHCDEIGIDFPEQKTLFKEIER
jgi:predicted HicB family RNase H-like nuclease